jgi:hypothetical protein
LIGQSHSRNPYWTEPFQKSLLDRAIPEILKRL